MGILPDRTDGAAEVTALLMYWCCSRRGLRGGGPGPHPRHEPFLGFGPIPWPAPEPILRWTESKSRRMPKL
ncbi:hypothetical protein SLNWT_3315 [Streptomyces albus]|uniref:Uncharacterized protein n=1 Tax=Streptomyces albus (strain ATCC 21838 / DSM 41398 / FERM P-419 / JCM 4703 / NBRC 107858) TaxID=1081613 RepID=A0A0B5EYF7_STRA4|nr:hypothetical protein SLNWT_3315 [Streptomyces albus]AOU77998.1 hypothetical protein SLNHY_3307 [Streptomyces albus]AYN33753.1 hypothetical protein DUI70_3252 [Streptomyces albus]